MGMALDYTHFFLDRAPSEIWNRLNFLTDVQRRLVERCLGREGAPLGEQESPSDYIF